MTTLSSHTSPGPFSPEPFRRFFAARTMAPDGLLGRMTATMRLLMTGALTLGSLAAGAVAEAADVRTALVAGAAIMVLAWAPLAFSPLRLRNPEAAVGGAGE